MAHWKDATVTNDGVEMLNEWMAGRVIKVVSAYGGSGTVPVDELAEQTNLVNYRQQLHLLGEENGPDGKTVQVQVSNAEVAEEYALNQVGVFAVLDPGRETETEEKLLFIMQDEKGVTIPSCMDASFLLELYCLIGITNNGRFEVSVSAAGIVTVAYLRETLEQAIAAHNADDGAHHSLTARMRAIETALNGSFTIIQEGDPTAETVGRKGQHYINPQTGGEFVCGGSTEDGYIWEPVGNGKSIHNMLETAAGMETRLTDIGARLGLLELMYKTQVSGNPFTVTFESLTGLVASGVWNAALSRLEF